ncbi:MAG: InlB B-repeat-containing protein, partial [Muribaculaceae bacterium]|nr:InlB B-repeat-containing protein [Muribaculaceae bacterium]
NKAIDETTFTAADVALRCQGKVVDCSGLKIARSSDWTDSNISYDLIFGSLTSQSGYYSLRVDCAGISDSEGFTGSTAGTAAWNQLADGKVDISVEVTPAEGGEVSPSGARYDFGEQLTFKATAAEGYDFAAWMEDGVELSRDESLDYTVLRDATLTASFVLRRYNVDITFDAEYGHVSGAASGIYSHGTVLELLAEPADCYQFAGWYRDGEVVSAEPQLRHTVDGPCTIEARFISQGSGVSEAVEDRLRVYPVPVADRLYVDGSFDTGDTLSFTDARGARVVVMTGLRSGVPVNVSSLAAGVYVVRLTRRDGTSAVARIVKL